VNDSEELVKALSACCARELEHLVMRQIEYAEARRVYDRLVDEEMLAERAHIQKKKERERAFERTTSAERCVQFSQGELRRRVFELSQRPTKPASTTEDMQ